MQQHTVVLTFNEHGNVVPLSDDGTTVSKNLEAQKNDKIRWISPHGAVAITFQKSSPFPAEASTRDEDFRTVANTGNFPYICSITTVDGEKHGWEGDCGGVVIIGGSTRGGG